MEEEEKAAADVKSSQAAPATSRKKPKQKSSASNSQAVSQSGEGEAAQAAAAASEITTADEPVTTAPSERHSTDDNAARHELAHAAATAVESVAPATTGAGTDKGQSQIDAPAETKSADPNPVANTPKPVAEAASAHDKKDSEPPATVKKAAAAPSQVIPAAAATPVLKAVTPAVEAPATQPTAAANTTPLLVPATEVKLPATASADAPTPEISAALAALASTSGIDMLGPACLVDGLQFYGNNMNTQRCSITLTCLISTGHLTCFAGTEDAAAPMDVDKSDAAVKPEAVAGSAEAPQPADAAIETVKPDAAKTSTGTVPLAASLTDAAMADAAVEDAEMVQYDEPEEEEQVPAGKELQVRKLCNNARL